MSANRRKLDICTRVGPGLVPLIAAALFSPVVQAGYFELFGFDAEWQLQGSYAYSIRLEKQGQGVVNSPPRKEVETPDYLKYPESNNYDDGDRNFEQYDVVNNRVTLLGELLLKKDGYGALIRGDAFYDAVYRGRNSNDSPDSISTTQEPYNEFTESAERFSGQRVRLLDAYAFGSWYVGDEGAINLRVGRHIAAWGESLFFLGVALSQSPADATKATVPGADVKSILLPVNQVSIQYTVNSNITLLGQYKLEHKPFELNPVGEFFSIADVVGPGAEFIYGIKNPFYFDNLGDPNLTSNDPVETANLIGQLAFGTDPGIPGVVPEGVFPPVGVPLTGQSPPGTPKGINVYREPNIYPADTGQWGLGMRYQLQSTTLGFYQLRYHNQTPAPVQNYGYALLVPEQVPGSGDLTTEYFDLLVPTTYNITFFDGIDLSAISFSTVLFGTNIAGELIYRHGVDVLVDVHAPILGLVPTPTRADTYQALLSDIYVAGPGWWGDSLVIVGETSFVHVGSITPASGPDPEQTFTDLTYDRDAWGFQFLVLADRRNLFDGWDLQIPISVAGIGHGQSSLLGGLGSLTGENDYRFGIGANFTRLQKMTLGLSYSGFFGGKPHFSKRPLQDRDTLAFTAKYSF